MKRKLSSIVLITFVFTAFHTHAQLRVGIMGGPQFATQNQIGELSAKTTFNTTAHAGVTLFVPFSKEFYLHTTLGYSGKGVTMKNIQFYDNLGNSLGTGDINVLIHYIELRSPLIYKATLSSRMDLAVGAGPYFGYALSGYRKINGENYFTFMGEKKSEIDFENEEYKRIDLGYTVEVNLHFTNQWVVGLYTSLGVLKIVEMQYYSVRNSAFGISFGYLLKKTPKNNIGR